MKKNYIFTLLLTLCFSTVSFGQTEIFNLAGGGVLPTGWVGDNNITSNDIDGGSYYLVDSGAPSDVITSASYDLSSYSTAEFKLDVASFGSGTHNQAKIEISIDGGTTFTDLGLATTTTSSSYIDGGTFAISNVSNQVKIRISNDGESGRGVRLRNIVLSAFTSDPSIAITSPTNNQVFPSTTGDILINFDVFNFTLSGDNGSEMTDGTGDGYIVGSLSVNGVPDGSVNIFSNSQLFDNPKPGETYLITVELVDNTGASLSPKAESSVTFSVELPCDLVLGTVDTTCDALTGGTDNYTGSIAFTGGNTGITYTITAPSGVTIGGENPNSDAVGTITFTGMSEGTDATITIVGGTGSSCDLSRTFDGPTCVSLPIIEDFTYSDGSLTDNSLWTGFSGTSGDLMVSSGKALVQHGTPSEDAQIKFAAVSGSIYYALDFTVMNPGSVISGTDNEYFALFKDSGSGFSAQFDIVPPATTGDFSVGIASGSSTADSVWATDLTYGVSYRATVKYDQDNNIAQLWIDAAIESDTSILGADLDGAGKSIVSFALRQSDSNLNEGILVDNLRIGTTFAETSLSISKTEIEGFATYPNPVTNNQFTITSLSTDAKQVSIYNVIGKRVLATDFSGTKSIIDVSSISSGLYILKVTEGNKTATSKLVIK